MDKESWFLIGTGTIGAIGATLVQRFFSRGEKVVDDATAFRQELRAEIAILNLRVEKQDSEIATWRDRYYVMADRMAEENRALKQRCAQLEMEVDRLRSQVQAHERSASPVL